MRKPHFTRIRCPKCGSGVGRNCLGKKNSYIVVHRERLEAWENSPEGKAVSAAIFAKYLRFQERKPKPEKPRTQELRLSLHYPSKPGIGAPCRKGTHSACFKLSCTCECHRLEAIKE
jgi:hypothetical protein